MAQRRVTGESRERYFTRNGMRYKITINWHWLDDGNKYHCIHVYRGNNRRAFRNWRWSTTPYNEFIRWE